MHLSAKSGIFLTQTLWTEAENLSVNSIRFSGAAAVFVIRFIFGRLFVVWREFQKPLLAGRKTSKRSIGPARESRLPGPMSVTLPPARSGPTDRSGVSLKPDRRGSRPGPAAWGDPRRTRPHRPSRRPARTPARSANRRSGRSCSTPTRPCGRNNSLHPPLSTLHTRCSTPTPPSWRNNCQLHEMPRETIPSLSTSGGPLSIQLLSRPSTRSNLHAVPD